MGTTLSCCRKPKATTTTNEEDEKNTINVGSFAKIVKKSCIWTTKKKKNIKQLNNLHLQQKNNNNNTKDDQLQMVTLEEWILGSPSLKNLQRNFINNSIIDEANPQSHLVVVCKPTKLNTSMMEKSAFSSQNCSSKIKIKIKKKVSFRLPKVADIFMLDSPEGHFENV